MKPAPFMFRRAESVGQAIELVGTHDGFAKLLAGGQTLGPMMNLRLVQPDMVVYISHLDELREATEIDGRLLLGAGTRHAAIEDGTIPEATNGLLRHVAGGLAYRAVRNRGTLGGSLVHADPSAEWPSVMTALGAQLRIRGQSGTRDLDIDDFFLGPMTPALESNELLEAVVIPQLSKGARWGFHKQCRKFGEFATSLSVVVIDDQRQQCRIVLGAAGGTPLLLSDTSAALGKGTGTAAGRERELRAAYERDVEAAGLLLDDYDHHVHGVTVIRAVMDALGQ